MSISDYDINIDLAADVNKELQGKRVSAPNIKTCWTCIHYMKTVEHCASEPVGNNHREPTYCCPKHETRAEVHARMLERKEVKI